MALHSSRSTLDLSRFDSLANHLRKYVRAVETGFLPLQQALNAHGLQDQVEWGRLPVRASPNLRLVRQLTDDVDEQVKYLGTIYAWHYLSLTNRRLLTFERSMATKKDRSLHYRRLVDRIGSGFKKLIGHFTANLLELYGGGRGSPELAFAVTGNLTDHEDIDMLVLARDRGAVEAASSIVARMSTKFLRHASRLHFYLAEQLGQPDLAATPSHYLEVLGEEYRDFVAATQLIGAQYLAGSRTLFDNFDTEVADRYRFRGRGFVAYEAFVRGALAAIEDILPRARGIEHLNPKREVSLPIKDVVFIAKARHSVGYRGLFELLDRLPVLDPDRANAYHSLNSALSFVEAFRYLFQLCVSQEEFVDVGDSESRARIGPVAAMMGFPSEEELLEHYFDLRYRCHEAVSELTDHFRQHLRRLNIFRRMARRRATGNLAVGLLRFLTVYSHEIFWEDLFDTIREHPDVTRRFVEDLYAIDEGERDVVIGRLVDRLMDDPHQALDGMAALSTTGEGIIDEAAVDMFALRAADRIAGDAACASKLAEAFFDYPDILDRFAASVSPGVLDQFTVAMSQHTGREFVKAADKMLLLTVVRHYSSNYAQRLFDRALPRFPEAIAFLDDSRELLRAANTNLDEVEDIHSYEQRKERIGDVYALHFLRAAVDTFRSRPIEDVAFGYMSSFDAVVNGLFRVCRAEVRMRGREFRGITDTRDFALFAAGGNAREEAFDADYDLIAVVDSDDPQRRKFYEKVIARLSIALARLGVMPHNRMADLTGRYVVSFDELEDVLSVSDEPRFVELSEVLGARRVIGTEELDFAFAQRIVSRFVTDDAAPFIRQMRIEMNARFEEVRQNPAAPWNLKEDPGGLRDIHMFLQILRAYYHVRQPVTRLAVDAIAAGDARVADHVRRVYRSLLFLMRVRDLYRLTVAADDALDPTQLELVAGLMGYDDSGALIESLQAHCVRANRGIEEVIYLLGLRV